MKHESIRRRIKKWKSQLQRDLDLSYDLEDVAIVNGTFDQKEEDRHRNNLIKDINDLTFLIHRLNERDENLKRKHNETTH